MLIVSEEWLKGNGLIFPRPLVEMPAQKQWRHKTTRPDEVRKEAILQRRQEKKRLTFERRKPYNLNTKNKSPDQHQVAGAAIFSLKIKQ